MADCLSGAGPCDHWQKTGQQCEVCAESDRAYGERALRSAINQAKRILEANGYTVTKSDS